MNTGVAYRGRLPGVWCDPALPRVADTAIRMDVAAFVGFAERGPIDDPQPLDDANQYRTIFGGDVVLAIDDNGAPVRAALPTAVQSFFDNGGRRAYVTRVAGDMSLSPVTTRVTSRLPLGHGSAIVRLDTDHAPPEAVRFLPATPGRWVSRLVVDATIRDKVLAVDSLHGSVALTSESRRMLDEGDVVLLRRPGSWSMLTVPSGSRAEFEPTGGWLDGDVVRLLRLELAVRLVSEGGTQIVERLTNLRFGAGETEDGSSVPWTDAVQPADTERFLPDRSMFLRAPRVGVITPVVGPLATPVEPEPEIEQPPDASPEALAADGLRDYDVTSLFLDSRLRGQTVEGFRSEVERLTLDDGPRLRGIHSLALQPEVAIVAVPDLYHLPWQVQTFVPDREPAEVVVVPDERPVGFIPCNLAEVAPTEVTVPLQVPVTRMIADPPSLYDPSGLHEVASVLGVLCAARADMVGVLALPRHAGLGEAEDLAATLRRRFSSSADVASYVGLWHPWGAVIDDHSQSRANVRFVPPDGAAAGTIAATEIDRGFWVEPAGRDIAGLVDSDSPQRADVVDLFDRGFNPISRFTSGFAAVSAHTLSTDRTMLQVTVRRLLIWVRLLALREGMRFVFEADNERFRAQVRSTFERYLERLQAVGALVAFEVELEDLSTRPLAHEGRVRVDLKLAPTSPIEFITVSLLRSGDGVVTIGGG